MCVMGRGERRKEEGEREKEDGGGVTDGEREGERERERGGGERAQLTFFRLLLFPSSPLQLSPCYREWSCSMLWVPSTTSVN